MGIDQEIITIKRIAAPVKNNIEALADPFQAAVGHKTGQGAHQAFVFELVSIININGADEAVLPLLKRQRWNPELQQSPELCKPDIHQRQADKIVLVSQAGAVMEAVILVGLMGQILLVARQEPERGAKQVKRHLGAGGFKKQLMIRGAGNDLEVIILEAIIQHNALGINVQAAIKHLCGVIQFWKGRSAECHRIGDQLILQPQPFAKQGFKNIGEPVAGFRRIYEQRADSLKLRQKSTRPEKKTKNY